MEKFLPKTLSGKLWWVAGIIVVGAVLGFVAFIFSPLSKAQIPSSFVDARQLASGYASSIVGDLSLVSDNIVQLQKLYGAKGSSNDALEIIVAATAKHQDAREKSILLATQLEKMARAIPDIHPDSAGQTALVAISSETALIGRLISQYNESLGSLLVSLRDHFSGTKYENPAQLNAMVDNINTETEAINQLNDQFVQLMQKFDSYYR
ncbi:MAG: hypothetical protein WC246_02265 [Candidatus Paceibacterota bacterium]|jgi:hypothetical protein